VKRKMILVWAFVVTAGVWVGAAGEAFAAGGVEYGIAARYPNDEGIGKDRDVLIFEDYELGHVDDLRRKGWRWNNKWGRGVYSLSEDPTLAFGGKKCLVKKMPRGREGAIMPRDLDSPEEGAVYHRVYLKFPKDAPSTRVMGITGVRDGWETWRAIGSAGWKPDGANYYCVTLTFHNRGGGIRPSWYPYHVDQKAQWGSNWDVNADIPTDRWFCMEIMTKLTTPGKVPGAEDTWRDGELRMWIDGKEVYTRTDVRYRTDPIVKTTMIFDQCYTSQKFKTDGVCYADNRVVARKYVGPMVTAKRPPTHPSLTGQPVKLPPRQKPESTGFGIANRYLNDRGIEKDPDVIFFEDFEVGELMELERRGWSPRWGPGLWANGTREKKGWKYYEIDDAAGAAFAGEKCLKKRLPKGGKGARMIRDLPAGEEVLYQRAYLKVPRKMPPNADHAVRIMGVTGVKDGTPTWQPYGARTPRSDGTGPFWLDLILVNFERRGKILSRKLVLQSQKTDTLYEVPGAEGKLPIDKWFCVEMKVKLNTPGEKDGELRLWVDGKEVLTVMQASFRSTRAVKIRSVQDEARGDTHHPFPDDYDFLVDNIVVARKYIGPAKGE